MSDFVWPSWLRDLLFVLLAFLGGVLGDVTRRLDRGEKIILTVVFVKGAGSAFTGVLMLFLCKYFNLSVEATGLSVGLFGWLGAEVTVGFLQRVVYSKFGVNGDSDDQSDKGSADVADRE